MEVLNREQQALKDRIEDFIARFEGNQDGNDEVSKVVKDQHWTVKRLSVNGIMFVLKIMTLC